jgi:hypothetical protein
MMKYNKFNNMEWVASALGFSADSLPVPKQKLKTTSHQVIELLQYCLDKGVNYLDIGYPYHLGEKKYMSGIISQVISDFPRDSVKIALTIPSYSIKTANDFELYLNMQLEWLKIEKADFCLLGMLNRDNWPVLNKLNVLEWVEKARSDGRIDKIGFSFHDHFQILKEIIAAYDHWAISQFQYSYVDENHDPGSSGIAYASSKDLAVVISEPLHKKRLSNSLPSEVLKLISSFPAYHSPTTWALQWVWNHPEVSVVLGEMSNITEAEEHISAANTFNPNSLTIKELIAYEKIKDYFKSKIIVPCPSCRPCMPCPQGIDVPRIFEIYNDAAIYNDYRTARKIYADENHRIELCNECGSCEKSCAKRLTIIQYLKQAQIALEND